MQLTFRGHTEKQTHFHYYMCKKVEISPPVDMEVAGSETGCKRVRGVLLLLLGIGGNASGRETERVQAVCRELVDFTGWLAGMLWRVCCSVS